MATETVRQKVLASIGHGNPATPSQIGHRLNMSTAAVRYHLSVLAADEQIVVAGTRRGGRRGRPEKLYRLSDRLLGDNLGGLADNVLGHWFNGLSPEEEEVAIDLLAHTLSAQMGGVDKGLPASKRLAQLTERLNTLHYKARWEAGASGPRVLFGHCPYASIIRRHPELCNMDVALLRHAMDSGVEQLSKIEPGGAAAQCIFAIGGSARVERGGTGSGR